MVVAEIGLGELFYVLLVTFFMVTYFIIFFWVVVDLVRDEDLSGPAKAGWFIMLLVLPVVSMFVYLAARGGGMARRHSMRHVSAPEYNPYAAQYTGHMPDDPMARARSLYEHGLPNDRM